jgi:fibronectin-binding autotransporter adhesin
MLGRPRTSWNAVGLAILAAWAPLAARAQTAVWTAGGGANTNFSNGANWMAGSPPPNDGSTTVDLPMEPNQQVAINSAASIAGIVFEGSSGTNQYVFNDAGGTLSIGSGGITETANANLYFTASIVLAQNQTWSLGFVNQESGVISGPGSLTTTGSAFIFGDNTFTGGVHVLSGTFSLGSGASAGTGTITLSDEATLATFFSPDSISNAIVLGNDTILATGPDTPLTLTGPITFSTATPNVIIGANSLVTLSGLVGGPSSTAITLTGSSPLPPADGGSQVVFKGTLNQVASVTITQAQLILAPVTPNPETSIASVTAGFQLQNGAYLGLDGTFTVPGAVAAFFTTYGPGLAAGIDGTIGFDDVETPGAANTFGDPIDLASFVRNGNFMGLGSATQAILTGNITPTSDNWYVFGGGGGTLTVTSDLEDNAGTSLLMTNAPSEVTLIIQGANNYTGSVLSSGGVLIFDSATLPAAAKIELDGGYVGYTEVPGLSSNAFIALFDATGAADGVVGFDQHSPTPGNNGASRLVGDAIDLSGFNSDSSVFIGTSTAVDLTAAAVITPLNYNYAFTGVKGGHLTVDSVLADQGSPTSLTLGLVNPIESSGSTSVVNLTGNNTFTGGTTINTGTVFINSNTAFGAASGVINIPGADSNDVPTVASYGGNPVSVANPITVGSNGYSQGVTLGSVNPSGNDMLVLNGIISDENGDDPGIIAIAGPVTLNAANTYSGGTLFTGVGNAAAFLGNSSALGTGPITIQDGSTIAPIGANVSLSASNTIALEGNSPLNLGQSGNTFTLTVNGPITGSGNVNISSNVVLNGLDTYSGPTIIDEANVVIGSGNTTPFGTGAVTLENGSSLSYAVSNPSVLDLSGTDPNSAVSLTAGQSLTLATDSAGGNFAGRITGDGTNTVTISGGGIQQLSGSSNYGGGTIITGTSTLIVGFDTPLGSGPVTVGSGSELGVTNGASVSNAITLSGNSTLSGYGAFNPSLTFATGDTVMPGLPISGEYVSTLTFANNVTFGTGGIYTLDVADAGGAAGTGYSTINVGAILDITAAPSSFTIALTSIGSGGAPGMATFNPTQAYSWTILTAGSIPVFNAGDFTINVGAFQNSLAGGSFGLTEAGNQLDLNFTPVPEPSTWALMLTGVAAAGAAYRRRRRA